ncbi:MAG: hypothetical protein QMD05_00585 [Candidatus Brocadiaceae bacterium]|jgi:hypothetical protein|nr:hypothetical protein [Candidatus Brocadiaceae bacterium]
MKKLEKPVTLFAAIEESQHEALRYIAYKEKKSIAEIVREAIENYTKNVSKKYPIHAGKA